MKKLLSVILAISLLLALTACGGKTATPPPSGEPAVSGPAESQPSGDSAEVPEEVPDQEVSTPAPEVPEEITPANAQVGNMLYYGQFEQDGDPENGPEPLEWVVLDKADDRILVITRFSILNEAYCANVKNGGTCWAESDLRLGLNSSDFLNAVFSKEEQAGICESVIQTERWKGDFASSDEETVDSLFLLSSQEVYQYFVTDEERTPGNTTAVNLNMSTEKEWWTRTPIGDRAYEAIYVSPNTIVWPSGIAHDGAPVIEGFGIRPAMWLSTAE